MKEFENTTVLITGAAGGIGQELCRQFAANGAAIAAMDRDLAVLDFAKTLVEQGYTASAAVVDIGEPTVVDRAIRSFGKALGPITVLVNNAGFSSATTLESTDGSSWATDINTNLNGTYYVTNAVIPQMKTARRGAIVNIASTNGMMALGDPAYSAAKSGMISFTKSVAMEYGRAGIRANAVCPGTVKTPIWHERIKLNPLVIEELKQWYPLGRVAEPKDIANAVLFLASDKASAISGANLAVDCGLSAGNLMMAKALTVNEFESN